MKDELIERLAEAIHEGVRRYHISRGRHIPAADVKWNELNEQQKEPIRAGARAMLEELQKHISFSIAFSKGEEPEMDMFGCRWVQKPNSPSKRRGGATDANIRIYPLMTGGTEVRAVDEARASKIEDSIKTFKRPEGEPSHLLSSPILKKIRASKKVEIHEDPDLKSMQGYP